MTSLGVFPYFLSKIVAEVPVACGLSALFGGLLYPAVGLQRTARKFMIFLAILTLQSFSSSALGLLIGAVAPSQDAALAMFPPLVVLMVIFNGFNISEESTPKRLRFIPKVSLVRWGFEGLCVNEVRTGGWLLGHWLTPHPPPHLSHLRPPLTAPPPSAPPPTTSPPTSPSQFEGLRFDCNVGRRGPCVATGEEALSQVSLEDSTLRRAVSAQVGAPCRPS